MRNACCDRQRKDQLHLSLLHTGRRGYGQSPARPAPLEFLASTPRHHPGQGEAPADDTTCPMPATETGRRRNQQECEVEKAYSHISDLFSPFATQTIPATVHEAPCILDGLLMNEERKSKRRQVASPTMSSPRARSWATRSPRASATCPAFEAAVRVRTLRCPEASAATGRRQGETWA